MHAISTSTLAITDAVRRPRIFRRTGVRRGLVALVMLTAAVAAFGFCPRGADAQTVNLTAGGPYTAVAGAPITLTGGSYTPLTSATWTFSDGTALTGLTVTKTFFRQGLYTAALTVTDVYGYTATAYTSISVSGASVAYTIVNGTVVTVNAGSAFWPYGLPVSIVAPSGVIAVPVQGTCAVSPAPAQILADVPVCSMQQGVHVPAIASN